MKRTLILMGMLLGAVWALMVWPLIGYNLRGVVLIALGVNFAVARLLFWLGYLVSPPLRSLGFAATFYPTCVGLGWSAWIWLNGIG